MKNDPQLNFIYLHTEAIGYGNHGIQTHKAFENIGVDVYDGLPGSPDIDAQKKRSKICKDVLFLTIPSHVAGWLDGQRKHLFTMWETDTLPPTLRDNIHNFDTIIVPSQTCKELYDKHHDNVHYVPLGVDAERWHYRERRPADTFFDFLCCGSGQRKGADLVTRAFNELFPPDFDPGDGPIPRLTLKNTKGQEFQGNNVRVINGFMTAEEETDLYASAHCYVQPSRGEGWGMQPLQAMAQGCPTILTNAHGHKPFARYGIPIGASKVKADYMDLFGESGNWWEPNYEDLKRSMWDVYTNYERFHLPYAGAQSRYVRERFTWEKSAQAIIKAIGGEDQLHERFKPNEIPTKWVTPEFKKFKVITNKNWTADIAGNTYSFKKGEEYWVPSDTKRILFEAKLLDPACLDADEGLSASQIERLGDYIADASLCPTCGQSYPEEESA